MLSNSLQTGYGKKRKSRSETAASRKNEFSRRENGNEGRRNYGITTIIDLDFYRLKGGILAERNVWQKVQILQIFQVPV